MWHTSDNITAVGAYIAPRLRCPYTVTRISIKPMRPALRKPQINGMRFGLLQPSFSLPVMWRYTWSADSAWWMWMEVSSTSAWRWMTSVST